MWVRVWVQVRVWSVGADKGMDVALEVVEVADIDQKACAPGHRVTQDLVHIGHT